MKRQIRESEVMVYAIGIDSRSTDADVDAAARAARAQPPPRSPFPFPMPGGRRPAAAFASRALRAHRAAAARNDRVNVAALRDITDDSGGRTEIVRDSRDLDPATERIADELSQQYSLGYPSTGKKDGRWHTIRVEVRTGGVSACARGAATWRAESAVRSASQLESSLSASCQLESCELTAGR